MAAAPLEGKTVVVTRPREQAASLVGPLERLGAEVLVVPTIRIEARPLDGALRAAIARLAEYQLVVFASANAVRVFCGYLEEVRGESPAAALAPVSVAVIGPATGAALAQRGVRGDVVPDEYVAESLVRALKCRGLAPSGARVLIPQAGEARVVLADSLRARGALVDVLPVYDTLPAEHLLVPAERIERADYIIFTSGSTVRHFVGLMESSPGASEGPAAPGAVRSLAERLEGARLCSIGPVTSQTLRDLGLPVALEAAEYTTAGLVAAIVAAACALDG